MPVIAHNIASQFTNRQLNITTGKKTKSAEKLSSGYKINRSADDAAGLQISEKMRSQIRGLNQASRNIQDGVSLCQVADGALNETTDILQRMRELSIQSANGTNGESDRQAIQEEIDQLTKEVDRIANTTSFNQDIYPLKGNIIQKTNIVTEIHDSEFELPSNFYEKPHEIRVVNDLNTTTIVDGITYTGKVTLTIPVLGFKLEDAGKNYYSQYMDVTDSDYDANYNNNYSSRMEDYEITTTVTGANSSGNPYTSKWYSTKLSDLKIEQDTGYVFLISKNSGDKVYFYKENRGGIHFFGTTTNLQTVSPSAEIIQGMKNSQNQNPNVNEKMFINAKNIWIQAGANTGEGLALNLVDATAKGIGITDPNISVMSEGDCDDAMNRLDDAIQTVSSYRSQFGAYQNRLEHAKAVDDNTAENTQYAESRIRDTDMAEEMVEHSKNNILEQVGQSMLAQANQSTQGILSLLG